MATAQSPTKVKRKTLPVKDLSIWWSDLNAIPSEDKNEMWAAQMLFFMKNNAKLFLDPTRAAAYRATDRLELDENEYKQMIDPTTPMGAGGTADYFSADWKANPLYLHLKSIVKAEIEKSGKQLEINLTDKFAKTRRMNENYRILYRQAFRRIINEYAPLVGLPQISEEEDPFKWVKNFSEKQAEEGGTPANDVVDNYIDLIKNQITDSQDLALYNELIYKGDYEMAFELAIDYYLFRLNKWQERWADEFIDDVMHFNKACGEWYTDLSTGRPVVERFVPERLWVSPFRRKDGEDLMYYFIEYEITFGDFARTIGKNLTDQQLKKVFLYQKTQGATSRMTWVDDVTRPNRTRDNAMIRIGKCAALSQDLYLSDDLPMSYVDATYPDYNTIPTSWRKMDNGAYKIEKYYNVWYNWFYIPPSTNSLSKADYTWQAEFIFDIKKNQDQFRYGEDGRFSKSPLVIYDNSSQASFTDITQYYMPKIHFASHRFQNCLVNDLDAVVLADDFIGGLIAAVDESNKIGTDNADNATGNNGRDAMMEQWKMIQQGGKGFLKMTDKNGVMILDPSKLVLSIKNGYLEKAEKYIIIIASMYNEMTRALAQSAVTTGEDVKPRTPVAALEESVKASHNSIFAIQKGYETFLKQYGERMVQFVIEMAKEAKGGYTKRWNEFLDNVGYANGLAIEGMADVPPESVGLTVEYVDQTAKKEFLMQLATEYVKTKQLGEEFLNLMLSVDNWKIGFVLLRIGVKKAKQEAREEAAIQQQYIMEQKNADLQIAMTMMGAKTQGKISEIEAQGKVTDMINSALNEYKLNSQSVLKQMTTQNRITETIAKLDKENEIDLQQPIDSN